MNNEHENLIRHLKGIRKVVINNCHGGFGLSPGAVLKYCEKSGIQVWLEYDEQFKSLDMAHYFIVPAEQRIEASIQREPLQKKTRIGDFWLTLGTRFAIMNNRESTQQCSVNAKN